VHVKTQRTWIAAVVVLVAGTIAPAGASTAASADRDRRPDDRSPALCGRHDTPETGIQGDVPLADQQSGRADQGYNCGLAVVGYNDLGGEGGRDLAWSGDCAYVASGPGIKVIDVSDPTSPVVTQTLPIQVGSENLHAVTTRERAILVSSARRPSPDQPIPVHVWDVRTCTQPTLLGIAHFPGMQVHNIELNADATEIYGSLPLEVADISNLADPSTWTVEDFQCELAAQTTLGFTGILFTQTAFALDRPECANMLAHEFEFNAAGTRMYIGGQNGTALAAMADPLGRDWDTEQNMYVVDISQRPRQIISSWPGTGHGVRRATIDGEDFLLHSNENVGFNPNGCSPDELLPVEGAAHAFLSDISDEENPHQVSELEMAINRADLAYCAAQVESGVRSTIHYNEVDNPDDTTFAMLSQGNAGLRVWDVREPEEPTEVAYFNPGRFTLPNGSTLLDRSGNHTRYVTERVSCGGDRGRHDRHRPRCEVGYIWLTTRTGGFWVLELEPQVRRELGFSRNRNAHLYPNGRAARPTDLVSAGTAG